MMLLWTLSLLLLQATSTYGVYISVENGGQWGQWGHTETCPSGTSARAFSLLVEPSQGAGDDTSLNAIKLYCAGPSSTFFNGTVTSTTGSWGLWTTIQICPSGNLVRFALRVEADIFGDDTAANNILFQCSDHTMLVGHGGSWGIYGNWSGTCTSGICGIRTKVEKPQIGDDTALNDVQFLCC